ncbi:MAG: anti-sigma factor [Bacteroidetes bacterium]|nr:anti-sigma factor [Bacteroidota bacterium]MBS1757113.1 anti-sigma factor [Bacteroidota bacterium]
MEVQEIISSGILETYVLGLTSAEDTARVQVWIKQYPEVAAEINEIEEAMEKLAMAQAVEPNAAVKSKILNSISIKPDTSVKENNTKIYSISPVWKWVAAASIILLLGSVIFNYVYYNKYQTVNYENALTRQQLQNQDSQLAQLNSQLDMLNHNMSVVQSKYSEPVSLHGMDVAPNAAAKIFWMKNTGEVYLDPSNLPDAPAGKQYQLWAIVDGKPEDAGMIVKTKKGEQYQIQKMKSFGNAQAFAVTLETEGGNPTPKGAMYVMGKM